MTRRLAWRVAVLALILVLQGAIGSVAQAAGVRVWVNTGSGVYHCPGTRYYGNTKRGEFLDESAAAAQGYRPAYGSRCSQVASPPGGTTLQDNDGQAALSARRVWINTGSSVYHCPGTRYYGATKRGRFATEAEAIAAGNRPAHGSRCN